MLPSPRSLLTSLLGSILILCLLSLSASAQVPHDMAYQGVLTDAVGAPLTGPVDLVFSIYDLPSDGSPLYTETHEGVVIDSFDGSFLVQLGQGTTDPNSTSAFDSSLFKNGPNRYLEVQVGLGVDGEVLTPRQIIGAVPYALVAEDVVTDPATSTVGALIAAAQSSADAAQAAADAGVAGPVGPQGDPGPTGDQGPIGLTGADGAQGPAGANGTNGAQGIQGEAGPTGPQGIQGEAGPTGPQGPHDRPGNNNTTVGVNALLNNTTGFSNTASGVSALRSNTEGRNNTAIGYEALKVNITGIDNIAMGRGALIANTSGRANAALGNSALIKNTTGIRNTAVGVDGLRDNTIGGNNIALGHLAGSNIRCTPVDPDNPTSDEINACSRNIMIGNVGVATDARTIRIGRAGFGANDHTATHLAGNITVNGNPVISSTGEWVGNTAGLQGPAGADGADGAQGPVGPAGANGLNGADGAPAPTAEIENLTAQLALLQQQLTAQSTYFTTNFCGDQTIQPGIETCDDGNTSDGDGCSATCQIEFRFQACENGLTVEDTHTGLLWEKKDDTGGLHGVNRTFTWSTTNTGSSPFDGTALTTFLDGLNGSSFAGWADWRLPDIQEFQTIMRGPAVTRRLITLGGFVIEPETGLNTTGQQVTCGTSPCVDNDFAEVAGPTASAFYWSSRESGVTGQKFAVHAANFAVSVSGIQSIFKDFPFNARAVRTGSCSQ